MPNIEACLNEFALRYSKKLRIIYWKSKKDFFLKDDSLLTLEV